jgi:hypothetical protein
MLTATVDGVESLEQLGGCQSRSGCGGIEKNPTSVQSQLKLRLGDIMSLI